MINIPTVAGEKVFEIWGIPITNTLILSWIVVVALCLTALLVRNNLSVAPKGLQNFFEWFVELALGFLAGIFGSKKTAEKYFPFVAAIFLFVLVSNWTGLLPGIGSFGIYADEGGRTVFTPLLRSSASDLNFTLALAVITVVTVNILGAMAVGFWSYLGKFISFKSPMAFFVGILELISEVARMVSFSFRLFGNIFAGEVVLVIASFFLPYFLPIPFMAMEIFVGVVQAAVFAILAAVFLNIATERHGEAR